MNPGGVRIRNTQPRDFGRIEEISKLIYPTDIPWSAEYIRSHLAIFPEGQLVAVDGEQVLGMAASLIISWDDYDHLDSYNDFTDHGYFRNHDPKGRTLYGAEVMVDPAFRGRGIGSLLYEARRELVQQLGLLRIRAGARIPGYAALAEQLPVDEYVRQVIRGERYDATLSFQLKHDFRVLAVVPDYQTRDPRSANYAALIEWLNPDVATAEDFERTGGVFPCENARIRSIFPDHSASADPISPSSSASRTCRTVRMRTCSSSTSYTIQTSLKSICRTLRSVSGIAGVPRFGKDAR